MLCKKSIKQTSYTGHAVPGQTLDKHLTQCHAGGPHLVIEIRKGRPLKITIPFHGLEFPQHPVRVFKRLVRDEAGLHSL